MQLRRLEHDPRRRRIRQLGGLPKKRVEEVNDVELTEPVDLKVSIVAVDCLSVLVGVDTSRQYEL